MEWREPGLRDLNAPERIRAEGACQDGTIFAGGTFCSTGVYADASCFQGDFVAETLCDTGSAGGQPN